MLRQTRRRTKTNLPTRPPRSRTPSPPDLTGLILDNLRDAVITVDDELMVTSWNAGAEALYGVSEARMMGRHVGEGLGCGATKEELREIEKQLEPTGSLQRIVFRKNASGRTVPIRATLIKLRDEDGRSNGYLGVHSLAYETMEPPGQKLVLADAAGICRYISRAALAFLGEPSEGTGFDLFSRSHPGDATTVRSLVHEAIQRPGETCIAEFRLRSAEGSWRWVSATARHGHGAYDTSSVAIAFRDITPAKDAIAALENQRELTETILDNIPVMINLLDTRGRLIYVNPELERVIGWTEREVREDANMFARVYPDTDERERARQHIKRADHRWSAFDMTAKDGRSVHSIWINLKVGELTLGIGIDISERQRVVEASQRARDDLETRVEKALPASSPYGLTFRELTVLSLVASGKTDREIADLLSIGHRTVQTHISNILAKMGAKVRTEAGVRAVRERIIE